MFDELPVLTDREWKTSYRHEDGDLVNLFYVPALERAGRYDRTTGYFSATALAIAARGIERLIARGGRMRLIVGCTLGPEDKAAIESGYDLRTQVERNLLSVSLTPPDAAARHGLEALAWMISQHFLDVKIAVPTGPDGQPVFVGGIYHEKVGIITDGAENQLSFSGSINETYNGWLNNRESFHVHLSYAGGRELQHVTDETAAFERLWTGQANSVTVFDFPEAVKLKLLEFLPDDSRFVAPPPKVRKPEAIIEPVAEKLLADEVRRAVWTYIRYAPRMPNGLRVGEVTSTVKPWPHQIRTYVRMIESWPCQLLIADEVGLGKTISAGLFLRQAWLSGRAKRILLLVPKSVLPQWQNELYEKFNLNVPIYDGDKLVWKSTHARPGRIERKVSRTE